MVNYFIRVNNTDYPSHGIDGKVHNEDWDNRHTKTFTLEMTYEQAISIFKDGTKWSIVSVTSPDEGEEPFEPYEEVFDNSDFIFAGDVTDHRDGTVSVTMGQMTELEEAYELLYGGE